MQRLENFHEPHPASAQSIARVSNDYCLLNAKIRTFGPEPGKRNSGQ
ncbi:hypothetical protein BAR24066_02956 [Burkholderia arboris]|uniref:Uncharacterized protein n=1 Tax=Burkholderia arboris TaxID=488730 RepID=A0A9Q9SIA8_9BURK|nr:hypothetical protein BAR24066_02956 [Burkholderia arboris]